MGLMVIKFIKANWLMLLLTTSILLAFYAAYDYGKWVTKVTLTVEHQKVIAKYEAEKLANLNKILQLNNEATKLTTEFTQKMTDALVAIDANYQKELENAKKQPQAIIDEYAAANKRLSVDLKRSRTRSDCTVDSSSSSTSISDGIERAELSDDAASFFIGEANRADKIVLQLTACQATTNKYYSELVELNKKLATLTKK